jgi:hypothetical protein
VEIKGREERRMKGSPTYYIPNMLQTLKREYINWRTPCPWMMENCGKLVEAGLILIRFFFFFWFEFELNLFKFNVRDYVVSFTICNFGSPLFKSSKKIIVSHLE